MLVFAGVFLLSLVAFIMDIYELNSLNHNVFSHLALGLTSFGLIRFSQNYKNKIKMMDYYAVAGTVEIDVLEKSMVIHRYKGVDTSFELSLVSKVFQSYNSIFIIVDELSSFYVPNHNFDNFESRINFLDFLNKRIADSKLACGVSDATQHNS